MTDVQQLHSNSCEKHKHADRGLVTRAGYGNIWIVFDADLKVSTEVNISNCQVLKICFKMSAQMICPLFHKQIVSYLNKKVPKYLTRIVYFMT